MDRRVHLYLDEYGHFASSSSSRLLKQTGKLNVCTTIAHQTLSDLKDEENRQAELQAGNLVLFQLTGNDAEEMVKNLTVPPEEPKKDPQIKEIIPEEKIFDHLVTFGHSDPNVQIFIDKYLKPISKILTEKHKIPSSNEAEQRVLSADYVISNVPDTGAYKTIVTGKSGGRIAFETYRHSFLNAVPLINQILYEAMKDLEGIAWKLYFELFSAILMELRGFIGFWEADYPPQWGIDQRRNNLGFCQHELIRWLRVIDDENPMPRQKFIEKMATMQNNMKTLLKITADEKQWAELAVKFIDNLTDFEVDLGNCCDSLSEYPINMPTGEIDITAVGQQTKSFADRKGELSQKLATLPRYHTYIKTHDEQGVPQEGEVKLCPPDPPTEERIIDEEILKKIQEFSRRGTMKWQDIEKDIAERQAIAKQTMQTRPPIKQTPKEPGTYPLVSRSQTFYPR